MHHIPNFLTPYINTIWDGWLLYHDNGEIASPTEKSHEIPEEITEKITRIRNVIGLSLTGLDLTSKAIVSLTLLNFACYHLTGWMAGVGMTYFISIVILGLALINTSKIQETMRHLYYLLSIEQQDPEIKFHLTLSHIQAVKNEVAILKEQPLLSLPFVRIPFDRIHTILSGIDHALTGQAPPIPVDNDWELPETAKETLAQRQIQVEKYSHVTDFATRFFFYLTLFSMLGYHFTTWLSKDSINYIMIASISSFAYFHLARIDTLLKELTHSSKDQPQGKPSKVQFYLSLDHIKTMKEKVDALKKDLFLLKPPLNNLLTNLHQTFTTLEATLQEKALRLNSQ